MRRVLWSVLIVAGVNAAVLAQDQPSLGDIARANREKQQAQEASGAVPKMITNKDLPAPQRAGIPEENAADPMTGVSGVPHTYQNRPYQDGGQRYGERSFERPGASGARGGENLKGQIEAQEGRIAEMQARIDRANQFMHPNGSTVQYEGPINGRQAMQAQRIEMMQQMLDQQKQRLAEMQDTGRRDGMNTQVTEP